jgi:hypothetical protein
LRGVDNKGLNVRSKSRTSSRKPRRPVAKVLIPAANPHRLAALRNCRIKAGEEESALALQSPWRREHLFASQQALETVDFFGQQLAELDA